ncbi:hypothetical protein [Oryza sativa Japonica Group]|uniref:Uncharacterized protein n=2 Tax=Oryza sativa subsp. japonica TaxID=39947 RepID=Q7F515_ORYSJ|nr:hypothetical protein [Oryza sativa Japonica Group]BAC03296.1 hypothetical protein [Oryza sativa Japonica Group]
MLTPLVSAAPCPIPPRRPVPRRWRKDSAWRTPASDPTDDVANLLCWRGEGIRSRCRRRQRWEGGLLAADSKTLDTVPNTGRAVLSTAAVSSSSPSPTTNAYSSAHPPPTLNPPPTRNQRRIPSRRAHSRSPCQADSYSSSSPPPTPTPPPPWLPPSPTPTPRRRRL